MVKLIVFTKSVLIMKRRPQKNILNVVLISLLIGCQDSSIEQPLPDTTLAVDPQTSTISVSYEYYDKIYTLNITTDVVTGEEVSKSGDVEIIEQLLFGEGVARSMIALGQDKVKIFDSQAERIAFEKDLYNLEDFDLVGFDEEHEFGGRTNTHCNPSIITENNRSYHSIFAASSSGSPMPGAPFHSVFNLDGTFNHRIRKVEMDEGEKNIADYVSMGTTGINQPAVESICCLWPCDNTEDRRLLNIVVFDDDCPNGGTSLSLWLPAMFLNNTCLNAGTGTHKKFLNWIHYHLSSYSFANKVNSFNAQVWIKDYLYD